MRDRICPMGGFFERHPMLRDALLWSLPALVFGLMLRGLLLHYSPFAYWGKDSESYFNFAFDLQTRGTIGFDAKRRFIYPLFLLPVSLLPGSTLRWVAWLQHFIGLASLLPLGYVIRRSLVSWRLAIVPVTLFYTSIPILLWTEHEVIAETIFVSAIPWAMAGWVAWVSQTDRQRGCRLWWLFFAAYAVVVLTKPSARFFWPGLVVGLAMASAWRTLRVRHALALGALFLVSLTVGQESQGARLLYTTAFPLTRLETPLHAEYKAEIRDLVEPLRQHVGAYYLLCDEDFLKDPVSDPKRPAWAALDGDKERLSTIYRELAIEAILARPDLFLSFSVQRILASANPKEFGPTRFAPDYFPTRFAERYSDAIDDHPALLRNLFALSKDGPIPPLETIQRWINPHPTSPGVSFLQTFVAQFDRLFLILRDPEGKKPHDRVYTDFRPTPAGWWLVAGALVSLIGGMRKTVGPCVIITASYLFGVYLVGSVGVRYFMPAWPALALLLAVPAEAALVAARRLFRPKK
jgi:hypothetical protein